MTVASFDGSSVPGPVRRLGKRFALVVLSAVAALVLLEAVLQIAAFAVRDVTRSAGWSSASAVHVLCLGDSNTFGLSVPRDQAYPARLQALWNRDHRERAIEVVNLGYPGTNSSQVLRDIDRNLELFQPDLVLLRIGANDFWTVPVPVDGTTPQSWWAGLRQGSRLYRLFYMATRDPEVPGFQVHEAPDSGEGHGRGSFEYMGQVFELGHDGVGGVTDEEVPRLIGALAQNLRAIMARVHAHGARLAIATYASGAVFYKLGNDILRKVADEEHVPVVEIDRAFRSSVCPKEPCPEWIFPKGHVAKDHPTARGYDLEAGTIVQRLADWIEP